MVKSMKKVLIILMVCFIVCSCGNKKEEDSKLISGKDAKIEVINNSAILVDVREKSEYEENHISGALSIPLGNLDKIKEEIPSKDKVIIVYCASGTRSKKAKEKLLDMGYKKVYDLGSMVNWYE